MHPRSVSEMELYIELHRCDECGTSSDASAYETTFTGSKDERRRFYTGPCPKCGTNREFVFFAPFHWPTLSVYQFGGDEPSTILSADDFRAAAKMYMDRAPLNPTDLHFSEFFPAIRSLKWAASALDEVDKFHGGGDTASEREALAARVERYDAIKHTKADERRAGESLLTPVAKAGIDPSALDAHAEFAARDMKGPGRLVLDGATIEKGRYSNTDLRGARLVKCSLNASDFTFCKLDNAEILECSAIGASFANSDLRDAIIRKCDFTSASLQLCNLDDAVIDGGVFHKMNCDRAMWKRNKVTGVDFRGAVFTDAVLEGVLFEDCDFRGADLSRVKTVLQRMASTLNTRFSRCDLRGANIAGRRFDMTKLKHCKVFGIEGSPAIEGAYSVVAPDFSEAGDGSDVRDPQAVFDMWGAPRD